MANIGYFKRLLSNGSATGSAVEWPGGEGVFEVEGTWAGATASLQFQTANGTWLDVGTDTTKTANGAGGFVLHPCQIRVAITGSPSAVYAAVTRTGG